MGLLYAEKLFDVITVGIHIIDSEGITQYYSKRCQEIEGIRREWIIGRSMHELVKEGVYSKSAGLQVLATQKTYATTRRVNDRYIYSTSTPVFDKEELIYAVTSVVDMTRLEDLETDKSLSLCLLVPLSA